MKKFYYSLVLALVATLFAVGCTQDLTTDENLLPTDNVVKELMEATASLECDTNDDATRATLLDNNGGKIAWNEGDDNETKLEKIITQKYIALFPLSTEAWAEMRRTGYPKMFPVMNPDDGDGSLEYGDIIRRIPWVPTDPVAMGMVEATGVPALGGPDEQATRLWWDVDAPNF